MTPTTVVICDVDGTLTDGTVLLDADGRETLRFHKRDGWQVKAAAAAGIEVVLVTDDANTDIVRHRAAKMGATYHGPSAGKVEVVLYHRRAGARVVYVGDAPADVPAMMAADEAWTPDDGRIWPAVDGLRTAPVCGGAGVLDFVLRNLMERGK